MSHYFSLISSLPMLKFGDEPKMNIHEFLSAAEHYLDETSMEELRNLRLLPNEGHRFETGTFAEKFTHWELALRHSILKIRTARKSGFSLKNGDEQKREAIFECDADAVATNAYNTSNPLEREKVLDLARWTKADELVRGHIYDGDVLQSYCIKLQICEKMQGRNAALAAEHLDRTVESIDTGNEK